MEDAVLTAAAAALILAHLWPLYSYSDNGTHVCVYLAYSRDNCQTVVAYNIHATVVTRARSTM